MENTIETQKEMLSWQKPQIQKLTINIDTTGRFAPGSPSDFANEG